MIQILFFVGKVLEKFTGIEESFIVNPDRKNPPFGKDVSELYIDIDKIKEHYPDYEYPGYFFNTGQFVATPGVIDKTHFKNSFDPLRYPYYKNRNAFNLVDQAVLNAVLPVVAKRTNLKLGTADFMQWSVSFFNTIQHQKFSFFKDGECALIIHYAGDIRTHRLEKMKGSDLLQNFKKQYYSRLTTLGRQLDQLQDKLASVKLYTALLYKANRLRIELKNRGYLKLFINNNENT